MMSGQPTDTPRADAEHAWVRRHLVASVAGLLTDADEQRLQAHLADCGDCAAAWREQAESLNVDGAQDRHLAPAMIARWPAASASLRGLERDAVRLHLERCADCRADLEAMGHRPELAAAMARMSRPRRSFGAGFGWGAGVTALAAALAGLLLMRAPTGTGHGDGQSAIVPWVAPVTMRGGEPATVAVAAGSESFAILAAIPADWDLQRPVAITVTDPSGRVLLTSEATAGVPAGRTVSILIRIPGGVPVGEYRIVISQPRPDSPELRWESTFRVTAGR